MNGHAAEDADDADGGDPANESGGEGNEDAVGDDTMETPAARGDDSEPIARDDNHLEDVPDGAGCTEIWEHIGERRAGGGDGDAGGDEADS